MFLLEIQFGETDFTVHPVAGAAEHLGCSVINPEAQNLCRCIAFYPASSGRIFFWVLQTATRLMLNCKAWQQILQSRDSNTQLLANSVAATGKLGKELSEAVAANIIGGMNLRERYLLLAGLPGWLGFELPGNMLTAAGKTLQPIIKIIGRTRSTSQER